MTEWRDVTLGDVITLQRGFDLTEKTAEPGPYPVISSSGVGYSTSTPRVDGPGVVTGRKGVLGKVHYSPGPFWPHDTTLWVKDFKGADPRFVYYLLQTLPLANLDAGASNPTLNRNHAHLLPVRVPDRSTQQRVSSIVGAIDELIANNAGRIALLERTMRTVHRACFFAVDTPGVGRRGVEEDEAPEAWPRVNLGDVAQWLSGGTPRTSEPSYWNGHIPWITSGTLTSMLLDRSDRMVTQKGLEHGTRLVERDTLLFVVRGMSLVKEFRVGIADVSLAFGQDCKALVARDNVLPLYLAFAVITRADEIQGMVELAGHGTGKLSTDRLKAVQIPLPPRTLQQKFVEAVTPMRESMTALRLASDRLTAIRDLLLPKLVAGQIDVSHIDLDALEDEVA